MPAKIGFKQICAAAELYYYIVVFQVLFLMGDAICNDLENVKNLQIVFHCDHME